MLQFGNITINSEIVENTADMVIAAIAKAVPKESLCIAVIDEILESAKRRIQTMPTASFLQYLEEKKK